MNQTRSKVSPIRDDQLTLHMPRRRWSPVHSQTWTFWQQCSWYSSPDFIRHWMLYSIYLIKSLTAERVPSAEAEFSLSKHLRHGMSDGFMEKGITVANKQPLRRWYLQSECYAALQSAWVTVFPQKLGQFHKMVKCEVTWLPHNALINSEGPSWAWAEGTLLGSDLKILEMGIRRKQENLDGNLFFFIADL